MDIFSYTDLAFYLKRFGFFANVGDKISIPSIITIAG